MRAHAVFETDGSVSIQLTPESTEEMERLVEAVIYGGMKEKEVQSDDTPETFAFEAASVFAESDKTIFAVAAGPNGEVMENMERKPCAIEIRLWRKR